VTMNLSCTVKKIWRLKYWTHRRGHENKDGRKERERGRGGRERKVEREKEWKVKGREMARRRKRKKGKGDLQSLGNRSQLERQR